MGPMLKLLNVYSMNAGKSQAKAPNTDVRHDPKTRQREQILKWKY